ncbi:MAG: YicC family protein [Lachnospiraceae bacterium]|nr:YicC family protein [Lachnospiraceae bacterium]
MASSMTGFGHYEVVSSSLKVVVEIKSVNHRFLDMNLKLPRKFTFFENDARNLIKNRISRGKVDVYVSYEENLDQGVEVTYHPEVAKKYYDGLVQLKEQFGLTDNISIGLLAKFPNVFTEEAKEEDQDELSKILTEAFDGALDEFVKNRSQEGERLVSDLISKMDEMEGLVLKVEERSPEIIEEYKQRLLAKTKDLIDNNQIEESRIAAEVVLFSDKICVDEEIVRLKSHVKEGKDTLLHKEEVGRKMDFLAQEMNRESNTILSKSTDVTIADLGIELKTLIEKIREQIQNLE